MLLFDVYKWNRDEERKRKLSDSHIRSMGERKRKTILKRAE
jgi:hypothetical protein